MFELIFYTLFYLVFPTAPDTASFPDEVYAWEPKYYLAESSGSAREEIETLIYDECEQDPSLCAPEMSTLEYFVSNPIEFLLDS